MSCTTNSRESESITSSIKEEDSRTKGSVTTSLEANNTEAASNLPTENVPTKSENESITGIVYDDYCLKHSANYGHVECPNRIAVPYEHLSVTGLLRQCTLIPSREATDEELLLTHPQEHINYIRSFTYRVYRDDLEIDSEADSDDSELIRGPDGEFQKRRKMYGDCAFIDADTYANQYSETAARKAIGGLIELGEAILKNFYNVHDIPFEKEKSEEIKSVSTETVLVKQEKLSTTESIDEEVKSIIETITSKLSISDSPEVEATSSNVNGDNNSVKASPSDLATANTEPSTATVNVQSVTDDDSTRNKIINGFALIRPPGHHASICRASGFCLFNNVACAINVWRNRGLLKRAMIVDFDVHHGNGTQDLFETDPDILYLSIHRYDNGHFYPGTGTHLKIGEGEGKGYTINIPLNMKGMGDEEYLIAFKQVVVPVAEQFQPDIIVVSAGFDCAMGDPLGGMEVTPKGFAEITRMLMNIPIMQSKFVNSNSQNITTAETTRNIPIVFALEGGYNLSQIALSIAACVRTLLGQPLPPEDATPDESVLETSNRDNMKRSQHRHLFLKDLQKVIRLHSKYWKLSLPPELKGDMYDRESQ
jgi:acetoin utilization deacetylase AcuC-like enzyme